jgi:hypothetical protein
MQKTRSSSAKSGLLVEINQRSGLAGIYKAPRNLDQLGAINNIIQFARHSKRREK